MMSSPNLAAEAVRERSVSRWAVWQTVERQSFFILLLLLVALSSATAFYYYGSGLSLAYNDARSHLDIGRRVVEGLTPGIAQLGSVWLPLTHLLMIPTIWNDFMWHSGFSGTVQSMVAFVVTGILIYRFLQTLNVGRFGRWAGVAVFATNLNILYLQSTAMTELMLLMTMTAGAYYLLRWVKTETLPPLIGAAFWIMLSTLVRYDGWFLAMMATLFVLLYSWKRWNRGSAEGMMVLFGTLAGFGVVVWLLWNTLIFKDPFYFAFGPYAAHTQQEQLEAAGVLTTKGNLFFSVKVYVYALAYNLGILPLLLAAVGAVLLWRNRLVSPAVRAATIILLTPLLFNIIALFLGHSVLFVPGLSGTTWFNIRYGVIMAPAVAIFIGYLMGSVRGPRALHISLMILLAISLVQGLLFRDAVTIADARFGSSQKNVSEVSDWLARRVPRERGLVLISAASHDAIIFSSGLPMKRFIHEGTGPYWDSAMQTPDRWARWIIMRTYSDDDLTYRRLKASPALEKYTLVGSYSFADIYELKPAFVPFLNTHLSVTTAVRQ